MTLLSLTYITPFPIRGNNEALAREGIDTWKDLIFLESAAFRRNEVLAREGIDTLIPNIPHIDAFL